MSLPENSPFSLHRRRAAMAIAATTGLALVALSHHPVASHTASAQETLAQMVALQGTDGIVHGMLIVMLAILAAGFAVFGALLGARRPAVMFAITAYGLGCCAMVAAMLLDGFVTPQMARQFISAPEADIEVVRVVMRSLGTVIQVLTKAGLLSICAALLAWSYALCSGVKVSRWSFWCAAAGIAAGLLPAMLILFADIRLAPASLTAIFAIHAVWNLAATIVLYDLRPDSQN
ncbi:hypothetical protein [Undibacterium sp.]|jgi:hypothetical protein|uniref:hypothetical protein n=1 Tax=Undibacterium sp. TaxID=1914977 RepID=UPI002CD3EB4D|nr:hypothetical protein [Undibacterium sp.]HTD04672.1 hypothetical protein [Undibacterium sp.]